MASENLERLVARGLLARHATVRREVENHLRTARENLKTANLPAVPEGTRFQLLYEAAHSVSIAGLKLAGFRSREGDGNRQLTLGLAEETLALKKGAAAAFSEANRLRALMLYQGADVDVPASLHAALAQAVEEAILEIPMRIRGRDAAKPLE